MKKKKKTKKSTKKTAIKDLYLDRPTSHGGWPSGHGGSWIDSTPVNIQISNYLEKMGLLDRPDHARLSESSVRQIIRKSLLEYYNYD